MKGIVCAIRFSDHHIQWISYSLEHNNEVKGEIPLSMSLEYNKIYFFSEAEQKGEETICLMQSENELNECLNNYRNCTYPRYSYTIPDAQELWCIIMEMIIKSITDKMGESSFYPSGFVLSLPDGLDQSLKQLISKAAQYMEEKDMKTNPRRYKIIPNSIACASSYIKGIALDIGRTVETINEEECICIVDYGYYSTECYVILGCKQEAIVLNKGKINIGLTHVFEKMRSFLWHEGIIPYKKWTRYARDCFVEMRNTFTSFCTRNVENLNFKTRDKEDVNVSKEDMEKLLKNDTDEIFNMIDSTIKKAKEIVKEMKTIQVGWREFSINPEEIKIEDIFINFDTKNAFLIEKVNSDENYKMKELNNISSIVVNGLKFISLMITHEMDMNEKKEENENFNQTIYEEVTIVEVIQPNRFTVKYEKDKKEKGIQYSFPKNYITSEHFLSLEKLQASETIEKELKEYSKTENGIEKKSYTETRKQEWTLYENIEEKEYSIGTFYIPHESNYFISLHQHLGTIIPFSLSYVSEESEKQSIISLREDQFDFVIKSNEQSKEEMKQTNETESHFVQFNSMPIQIYKQLLRPTLSMRIEHLLNQIKNFKDNENEMMKIKSAMQKKATLLSKKGIKRPIINQRQIMIERKTGYDAKKYEEEINEYCELMEKQVTKK